PFPAKLSLYPHTQTGELRLVRIDAPGVALRTGELTSEEWYSFPYEIPAGQYALNCIEGETVLTQWKVERGDGLPKVPEPLYTPAPLKVTDSNGPLADDFFLDGRTWNRPAADGRLLHSTFEFEIQEEAILSLYTEPRDYLQ